MRVEIQGWLVMLPELGISLERQIGQDLVPDVRGESDGALLRYSSATIFILRLRK